MSISTIGVIFLILRLSTKKGLANLILAFLTICCMLFKLNSKLLLVKY